MDINAYPFQKEMVDEKNTNLKDYLKIDDPNW
jgi:hypothetical protein